MMAVSFWLWLLLLFTLDAEGNALYRSLSYVDSQHINNLDDFYDDYYLDDDYDDYYDDYYYDDDEYYYHTDDYGDFTDYSDYYEDRILDDFLENMDSDYLSLVDQDLWDDDDYWDGFYAGLMMQNTYDFDDFSVEQDDGLTFEQKVERTTKKWKERLSKLNPIPRIHQWIFDFVMSKVEKSLIDPFVHGAGIMIRDNKQKKMAAVTRSVSQALSWMPDVVAQKVNELLSGKADQLCDWIVSKWSDVMMRAFNDQKRKLAEDRGLKFYEYKYVEPEQPALKRSNEYLFNKMVKWLDQAFWNRVIGVVNGQYVPIMKGYKEQMHEYMAKKIEGIVSTLEGQIDSKLSIAPEEWRTDWKAKLRGFIEDKFGELARVMIDAAEEMAKIAFNTAKEAVLKGKGLVYIPSQHDVAARMAASEQMLYYDAYYGDTRAG